RLSYSNSWIHASEKYSPRICLSVWPDGHYRILRKNQEGQSQLLGGVLPAEQLTQLTILIGRSRFSQAFWNSRWLASPGSREFQGRSPARRQRATPGVDDS